MYSDAINQEFRSICSLSEVAASAYKEDAKYKLEREIETRRSNNKKCYWVVAASVALIAKIDMDLFFLASIVTAVLVAGFAVIPLCMAPRCHMNAVEAVKICASPRDISIQTSINLVAVLDSLIRKNAQAADYASVATYLLFGSFGNFVFMSILRRLALSLDVFFGIT